MVYYFKSLSFFFILISNEICSRSISNIRYIRVSPNIRNSMIYWNLIKVETCPIVAQ